jgi:hypothetical protein
MALRNQPYLPLYVQDFLTDEKLNMCSWSTQGIYIKILCVLHKQADYGSILFKQEDKQDFFTSLDFAAILVKHIPCQMYDMLNALEELLKYEVLVIENNRLLQRRMVKDNQTSMERSKAGKKGGGNPNLFKQNKSKKNKQEDKQNTENENENNNSISLNKKTVKVEDFYKAELEKSGNDLMYKKYILILFGDNDAGLRMEGVLGMRDQLTYEQFQKLYAKSKEKDVKLSTLTMSFENGNYYKNKKSLYLSLNDWLNKR